MKQNLLADCAGARACKRQVRRTVGSVLRSCKADVRACAACCRDGGESFEVAVCGNQFVKPGEACDGAALSSCTGRCRADCTCEAEMPVCGNGVVENGEACDGQALGSCEVACGPTCACVPPVCGNGVLSATEACDLGQEEACPG